MPLARARTFWSSQGIGSDRAILQRRVTEIVAEGEGFRPDAHDAINRQNRYTGGRTERVESTEDRERRQDQGSHVPRRSASGGWSSSLRTKASRSPL